MTPSSKDSLKRSTIPDGSTELPGVELEEDQDRPTPAVRKEPIPEFGDHTADVIYLF